MKPKELRNQSKQELSEKLVDLNKQLMDVQFKRRSGVEKPHLFKQLKRNIARIHTILNENKEVKSEKR